MHGSRFQKWHKQKKSPRWPQCHKWHCHHRGHLFLYTCAGRSKPLLSVFILPSSYSRKYRRMQDTASVSLCLRLFLAFLIFSCLQTNLFAIAMPGNGKQVRFPAMRSRRNTCNRKPCTHDNDGYRTSVTVAGKRCFPPLSLRSPLSFPVARCAIISAPFSFSPLHICLRFHAAFRTASVCHFRCWGKGKDGIRNTNFLATISTLRKLR